MRAVAAGRDGTVEGQFIEESPAELIARLAGYVSPGDGAAHARFVSQVWGEAAVAPELAAVARATHERLEQHLAGLLAERQAAEYGKAEHGGKETQGDPAGEGVSDPYAASRVALASLIGLAALVASGVPVDTASFVQEIGRLVEP